MPRGIRLRNETRTDRTDRQEHAGGLRRPKDAIYDKVISNIQEVRARKGRVVAVANEDDHDIDALAEFVIRVPRTFGFFGPIINVIPLQLLAYYIAVERGTNVDQPRNLAKSVTVE